MLKLWDSFDILSNTKGSKDKVKFIDSMNGYIWEKDFKMIVTAALKQGLSWHIGSVDKLPNTNNTLSLFGVQETRRYSLNEAVNVLYQLHEKGSANSKDKLHVSDVRNTLDKEDRKLFDMVINRDLKVGCGLSSFRKAFGKDFCPDFPKMLCSSFNEEKILKNINFPAYSQLKSDGARAMCVVGRAGLFSRNGSLIGCLQHIIDDCIKTYGESYVVDGELVVVDFDGNILSREEGNGIVNKCIQGTATISEALRVRYIVWDVIHLDIFEGRSSCWSPYDTRWDMVNESLEECPSVYIIPTKCRIVNNLAEAKQHYNDLVNEGEEGTILKDQEGPWEDKRSSTQYKFKEEFPADFAIVGWYYGKKGSKYETMIGGLECESKCGLIKFNVGSGLSDNDRKLDGDSLIGKCVEVIYNARTKAIGSETYSLFLPRVVVLRFDKDSHEANTLEDCIALEKASRELS